MTSDEQLEAWVRGEPKHMGDKASGQCCPDFSCCRPELLQPVEVRRAFALADDSGREKFLMMFLGTAFSGLGRKVHVAGGGADD